MQLGDILGRGGEPGKIFKLLKRLETEAGPDVVRMSPPLIVAPEEIDIAAEAFSTALEKVAAAWGWMP